MNSEADLPFWLAHDLDTDGAGPRDTFTCVACIGKGQLDEGPAASRGAQEGRRAVAVLHAAEVSMQDQCSAIRVHQGVLLALQHLLARIVAVRATGLGGLRALAVDHRRCRAGLAPGALPVEGDKVVAEASGTPSSRSRANQRYTVRLGRKLSGRRRQAQPARRT